MIFFTDWFLACIISSHIALIIDMTEQQPNCILPDGSFCTICCYLIIDDILRDGTPLRNQLHFPCMNMVGGECSRYDIRSETCREFNCHKASPSLLRTLYTIANMHSLPTDNLPPKPEANNFYFRGLR